MFYLFSPFSKLRACLMWKILSLIGSVHTLCINFPVQLAICLLLRWNKPTFFYVRTWALSLIRQIFTEFIVVETLFPDMFPWVAKLENILFRSKICVCEAKMFLTRFRNISLLPRCTVSVLLQHMFLVQLLKKNWETFVSAAMFPQQCLLV